VFRSYPGSAGTIGPWRVFEVHGTAAEFHELPLPETAQPTIWVFRPTADALVLGSGQRAVVDQVRARLEPELAVCRRRSGGGAVLVDRSMLWMDVLIPVGDVTFDDDIGATFLWIGAAWQAAFAEVGVATDRWEARSERSPLADNVCFAGRGWGELTRPVDGPGPRGWCKVLGLSQRRTRWGARVQCLATMVPQVERVAGLLAGTADGPAPTPDAPAVMVDLEAAVLRNLTGG